jgi:hypothetical protein
MVKLGNEKFVGNAPAVIELENRKKTDVNKSILEEILDEEIVLEQ